MQYRADYIIPIALAGLFSALLVNVFNKPTQSDKPRESIAYKLPVQGQLLTVLQHGLKKDLLVTYLPSQRKPWGALIQIEEGLDSAKFKVKRVGSQTFCGKKVTVYQVIKPDAYLPNGQISDYVRRKNPRKLFIAKSIIWSCNMYNCSFLGLHKNYVYNFTLEKGEICGFIKFNHDVKEIVDIWLLNRRKPIMTGDKKHG